MTTTPDTTPAGPDLADVDQRATELVVTSRDALTATIAAGMLDVIGQPKHLPTVIFAETDPEQVQAIWNLALAVGYRAGMRAGRPRWEREEFERAQEALADAGYNAMARLIGRALRPPGGTGESAEQHPADTEQARGDHR